MRSWNSLPRGASVFFLVRRSNPCRKTGPCFIAQQLGSRQRTCRLLLAKLLVEKRIVKPGTRSVGRARAIVDRIQPRPVAGGEAHGARFAACIKLAPGQRKRPQRPASRSNRVHFAVGSRVMCRRNRVRALANNFAVAHNHSRKRTACARVHVLNRQLNCAAQKFRIRLGGNCQLALNLPKGRK